MLRLYMPFLMPSFFRSREADGTNLAHFNVSSKGSKAHPIYVSLGESWPCARVPPVSLPICHQSLAHTFDRHVLSNIANLPAELRHSDGGMEVAGLIPTYSQHAKEGLSASTHGDNRKRLLWQCFRQLLSPLLASAVDAGEVDGNVKGLRDGFRCVMHVAVHCAIVLSASHLYEVTHHAGRWDAEQICLRATSFAILLGARSPRCAALRVFLCVPWR